MDLEDDLSAIIKVSWVDYFGYLSYYIIANFIRLPFFDLAHYLRVGEFQYQPKDYFVTGSIFVFQFILTLLVYYLTPNTNVEAKEKLRDFFRFKKLISMLATFGILLYLVWFLIGVYESFANVLLFGESFIINQDLYDYIYAIFLQLAFVFTIFFLYKGIKDIKLNNNKMVMK